MHDHLLNKGVVGLAMLFPPRRPFVAIFRQISQQNLPTDGTKAEAARLLRVVGAAVVDEGSDLLGTHARP